MNGMGIWIPLLLWHNVHATEPETLAYQKALSSTHMWLLGAATFRNSRNFKAMSHCHALVARAHFLSFLGLTVSLWEGDDNSKRWSVVVLSKSSIPTCTHVYTIDFGKYNWTLTSCRLRLWSIWRQRSGVYKPYRSPFWVPLPDTWLESWAGVKPHPEKIDVVAGETV